MTGASLRYRPEIDGLRALAVLLVIFYHADLGFLSGGFIGVDVFFVISGYLITSILLSDLKSGSFSLSAFYERRCRRILPPLVAMAAAVTLAGWFWFMPADYRDFGSSLKAMATFIANHYFYSKTGYFDTASFTKPLLHTWSLAVEEQFYIFLPLLLWFFYKKKPGLIPAVLTLLFFLSLTASCALSRVAPSAAFYLLPSRFWELILGSLLALWPKNLSPGSLGSAVLSWAGLLAIVWSALSFTAETVFPGPWALLPSLGAALFILANSRPELISWAKAGLASVWPVRVGKISYSLYLWHWPLLVIPRYINDEPLSLATTLFCLILIFPVSYLSYRFIENPVRLKLVLPTRRAIFTASLISLIILVSVGHVIRRSGGLTFRLPMPARIYAEGANDRYGQPPWLKYQHRTTLNQVAYDLTLWNIQPDLPPTFAVMGNSHVRMWLGAVDQLAEEYGLGGLVLNPSDANPEGRRCVFVEDLDSRPGAWNCDDYLNAFLDLAQEQGIKHVLMGFRYSPMFGLPVKPENSEARGEEDYLARGLANTLAAAEKRGLQLWVIENVPEYDTRVPHTLARQALKGHGPDLMAYDYQYFLKRNAQMEKIIAGINSKSLHFLEVGSLMCPGSSCRPGDEQGSFYTDDNHLSRYGALIFRSALSPFFLSVIDGSEQPEPPDKSR